MKYYSLERILRKNAKYNIIFGERSNGKTYAWKEYVLRRFWESGEQCALVRRWGDDIKGKRAQVMFSDVVTNKLILRITKNEWSDVYYRSGQWFLCNYADNGDRIVNDTPFCYGFSLNAMEHDKSTSYPLITTIVFDEFLSRTGYIPDEFILFMNVCSTIIRGRNNVKIFMIGNTVNKYCPYFKEMGLVNIPKMSQGSIDVYRYGESDLTVAVEHVAATKGGKDSDTYFAFNNPKLKMITGGEWEIDIYPHLPEKYTPAQVGYKFFVVFDGNILQCDIVCKPTMEFIFIHRKTTPLQENSYDLIYQEEYNPRPNFRRNLLKAGSKMEQKIKNLFALEKVFYQDNEIGEIIFNYLKWCKG